MCLVVWLSGRCCRTEHACPMCHGIQMKTQKGWGMLKEIKRKDSKMKRKRNMENKTLSRSCWIWQECRSWVFSLQTWTEGTTDTTGVWRTGLVTVQATGMKSLELERTRNYSTTQSRILAHLLLLELIVDIWTLCGKSLQMSACQAEQDRALAKGTLDKNSYFIHFGLQHFLASRSHNFYHSRIICLEVKQHRNFSWISLVSCRINYPCN